jgi:phospholipid N-methyltransferase
VNDSLDLAARLRFLGSFLREPLTVGSFWPSSPALAELILDKCDLFRRRVVAELGPGTGAFTGPILERISSASRFLAVEISSQNVRELHRQFPYLELYCGSAAALPEYLKRQGDLKTKADCIVSGLAWGNMLPETQALILDAIVGSLAPDGVFTTFAYAHARWFPTSRRFRGLLLDNFARVETTRVLWRNLPPAYVYRCWQQR